MILQSCILFFSMLNQIDPAVTKAVIKVESSGRPFAIGRSHQEIGLMQIRDKYVPESSLQLFNPCTNVMRGTQILGKLKADCKMCIQRVYLNAYNLGPVGAAKLKYPTKWKYHRKVLANLK